MPYGLTAASQASGARCRFQSLIWVACPTGSSLHWSGLHQSACFNPSYGLHALRAYSATSPCQSSRCRFQSLIWVACPTGPTRRPSTSWPRPFQSLIWVACPTGGGRHRGMAFRLFSFNPSYGLHALRAVDAIGGWRFGCLVSIPHMGCMPYGHD